MVKEGLFQGRPRGESGSAALLFRPPHQAFRVRSMNFRRIADNLIEEAMRQGAFDKLPGAGRPLAPLPDGDPFEILMGRILQRSGAVPLEVELKRSIADKARKVQEETDPEKRQAGLRELSELRLKLDIAMEGRAAESRRR